MYHLRLLGSLSLEDPSGAVSASVVRHRPLAVLALLAVARDKGCSRDKLVGYLWPETEQDRARHRLTDAVYLVRRSLGENAVLAVGDTLRLNPELVEADVAGFLDALDSNEPEAAVGFYDGPFLDGFYVSGALEFERWVEAERQRLADAYADALEELAEHSERAEDYRRAVNWWKRLVAHDPYNTRYALRLMLALAAGGDRGNALQVAHEHERRLSEELGMEPDAELLALRQRLLGNSAQEGEPSRRALELATAEPRAVPPEPVPVSPAQEQRTESRPVSLLRVVTIYALVSLAVLAAVHFFTVQFGLPDWFFPSAVVVLLVCLPIIVATALVQGAVISAKAAGAEAGPRTAAAKRWLTWRNAVGVTVVALTVLGLAVAGYMAMRVMGIGPWGTLTAKGVLEERDLIVLADFEDHTGDSTLALALTDLVRVDLDQSPTVRIANADYVGRVLRRMERDPDAPLADDLAREVAIREGLKAIVTGKIHMVGSSYLLSLELAAAETGETLASLHETASDLDATIPAIERMSRTLRERIGESLKTIRTSPPLDQVRTASLEALRFHSLAIRANFRRQDYRGALDLVNRALDIDTLFASAYRLRSMLLSNLGIERPQMIADATRAYQLRHRLPLSERYRMEAHYHHIVTGDLEKAISAYQAELELYPASPGPLNNVGLLYNRLRQYARAEEALRRCLELDSLALSCYHHLSLAQFNLGKRDEAESTLQRCEEVLPDDPMRDRLRAHFASAQGDYDAAVVHLRSWVDVRSEDLLRQAFVNWFMARLAQVQGRLAEAESYLRDVMAVYEERGMANLYLVAVGELAGLRVWFLGDTARALEMVADALERHPLDSIEPIERRYAPLAGFYAFAGAPERARELLVEWETVVPPDLRRTQEVARRRGWGAVALAEGRTEEALVEFRFLQERSACPICSLPLLGRANELASQPDSALAMYERYLTTPYYWRVLGGLSPAGGAEPYWLPVVYERLGDLYKQRGDTTKAIHYYGKLIDLWKNADPELQPQVEAARRAIEALTPDT